MQTSLNNLIGINPKETDAFAFISLFADYKPILNDQQRARLKKIFQITNKNYNVFNSYNHYKDSRVSKEAWFVKSRMAGLYERHFSVCNIINDIKTIRIDPDKVYTACFGGDVEGISEAGCGIIIKDDLDCEIWKNYYYIGTCTLPQAEYTSLIYSLLIALLLNIRKLIIKGTNKIVMYQLLGYYEVKDPYIKILFNESVTLFKNFQFVVPTLQYQFMNRDVLGLARLGRYERTSY